MHPEAQVSQDNTQEGMGSHIPTGFPGLCLCFEQENWEQSEGDNGSFRDTLAQEQAFD